MALNPSKIAEKYVTRSGAAGADYKSGVLETPKDQAELAIAAAPNYEAGLQAAFADNRFEKGLRKSGKGKWLKNASTKGATNYPTGVRAAKGDYQEGVAPYLSALDSIVYVPKGPRGSPGNVARVTQVMETMSRIKAGL